MIITIFIDRYYSYKQWKNFEDILSSRKKKKRKIFLFKLVQGTVAERHGYKLQAVSKRHNVLLKTSLEHTRQVKDLVFSCRLVRLLQFQVFYVCTISTSKNRENKNVNIRQKKINKNKKC